MDLAYRGYRHSVAVSNNIASHTPTYKSLKYGKHSFDLDNELEHILSKYDFVELFSKQLLSPFQCSVS
jgi:hypothetical protein